jgi:hypothetical protein
MSKQSTLKVVAFFFVASMMLNSCANGKLSSGRDTAKLTIDELAVSDYFAEDSGADLSTRVEFVKALKEMQERPLKEVGPKGGAYRFLWLRSFHQPLCVTAYLPDTGESLVTGKVIETAPRAGATEPFRRKELKTVRIQLSKEKAGALKKAFEQKNFFWLDPYDDYSRPPLIEFDFNGRHFSSPTGGIMKDGASWVIEGWNHGAYRLLQRQSPGEDDPVSELATLLMTESNLLPKNEREIY